jgi:hypothetical protein
LAPRSWLTSSPAVATAPRAAPRAHLVVGGAAGVVDQLALVGGEHVGRAIATAGGGGERERRTAL